MDTRELQPEQPRTPAIELGESRFYGVVERGLGNLRNAVELNHVRLEAPVAAQAPDAIPPVDQVSAEAALDQQVAAQTPEVLDMAERLLAQAEATREQPGQTVEAPVAMANEAEATQAYLQDARAAVASAATTAYPPNPDFAPNPFDAQASANVAVDEQMGTVAPEVNQALEAYLSEPGSMN